MLREAILGQDSLFIILKLAGRLVVRSSMTVRREMQTSHEKLFIYTVHTHESVDFSVL